MVSAECQVVKAENAVGAQRRQFRFWLEMEPSQPFSLRIQASTTHFPVSAAESFTTPTPANLYHSTGVEKGEKANLHWCAAKLALCGGKADFVAFSNFHDKIFPPWLIPSYQRFNTGPRIAEYLKTSVKVDACSSTHHCVCRPWLS